MAKTHRRFTFLLKNRGFQVASAIPVLLVTFFTFSCGNSPTDKAQAQVEIQIGTQVWMDKNYDGITFRNGDTIPHIQSREAWVKAGSEGKPAWCYYQNEPAMGEKYGRMYNWYAVNDPRGLTPPGWHVPTNDEWIKLEDYLGVEAAGLRLKCDAGWDSSGNGNNNVKFCAMPGGYRTRDGNFTGSGIFVYLTSSAEVSGKDIWGRGIHYANESIMRCALEKVFGLYVRCIKD